MLCGVSGSLLLLEERKDIKSCNLLQLPLSPLSPNLFLQLGQKLQLRSIFLGLQLDAAVLFIPARGDAAAIQLSVHHSISLVGRPRIEILPNIKMSVVSMYYSTIASAQ